MSFAEADGLRSWRVEEAAPKALPIVEQTSATLVQRVLGIPLEGVAEDDIVRVKRRTVVELDAVTELAGPDLGVCACRALGREGRHGVRAVVAIERLVALLAGPQAFAV